MERPKRLDAEDIGPEDTFEGDYGRLLARVFEKAGAPCRIRTCDLLVRSQTLYPAELRALTSG